MGSDLVSPRVAIVFPGQGSQRLGMLDALPPSPLSVELIEYAETRSGLHLRDIADSGTPAQLADTRAAQPLLFLADVAWGGALLEAGMCPHGLAGHSLGELAALALAGVFDPRTGVDLIVERSRLMADCAASTPGGMVAVLGLDASAVSNALGGIQGVWVANDNAPGQIVVSGTHEGLSAASAALASAGARRLVPLDVAGPFHCPLMEPAGEAFARVLAEVEVADAQIPVWQNAAPEPETRGESIRARLASQIASPVRWTETMLSFAATGITVVVEAGPGSVLAGLARRVQPLRAVSAQESGLSGLLEEVASS